MANENNNLELKIFVTALLLQELLDETVGETKFKHKLRRDINSVTKALDTMLTVEIWEYRQMSYTQSNRNQ